jgi:hypothetical protein
VSRFILLTAFFAVAIGGFGAAVMLSSCRDHPLTVAEKAELDRADFDSKVWVDPVTGCQYLRIYEEYTPRYAADGVHVMGCKG